MLDRHDATEQACGNGADPAEMPMDFIEMLFGAAPDGGDGTLEAAWLAAISVVVLVLALRRRITAWLAARGSRPSR